MSTPASRAGKSLLATDETDEDLFSEASAWETHGDYESYLERSKSEQALLRERVAEADNGVFISGEAMIRWIESWGTDNELPPPEPDIFPPPKST